MTVPMYFPAAPWNLDDALACSILVGTAYDMYKQWIAQDKPHESHFEWTPDGPQDLNYSKPIWGKTTVLWVIKHSEPFAFVAQDNAGTVYLSFRGTESASDWFEDAIIDQDPYTFAPSYGEVHKGFLELYETIREDMLEALNAAQNPKRLLITGHSLGSGLSTLAVPDIINNTAFKDEVGRRWLSH